MEEDPAEVLEAVEGALLHGLQAAVREVEAGQLRQAVEGAGGHQREGVGAEREGHEAGGVAVQGGGRNLQRREQTLQFNFVNGIQIHRLK